jgi:hypothetical protein
MPPPATGPFLVYAKALQEFFKGHEMTAGEWEQHASRIYRILDQYQKEGYQALMKIGGQYGGAFLCDGVGLGKTFIGLMLIDRLVNHERKRVALIVPKAARAPVWEKELRKRLPHLYGAFSNLLVLNHTDLNRKAQHVLDNIQRVKEMADVIIIDEAHHFRNPGVKGGGDLAPSRYWNLFDVCEGKTIFFLTATPAADAKHVEKAWSQNAVVLGYDVHGTAWLWPDKVRVMQGIVVGMTGSGKTTLLRNIITQDLTRRVGPAQDRHKIPMVIFDGKGDLDFFYELLPHINRAGRLGDLRLINPARPDLSCLYNPFHTTDENYMAQVNMVFGSFNLHDEFFAKHQLNYLADIVRILHHTGVAFNFYDVIVMALDEEVLREQIEKARRHIQADREVSMQRGLNFEMSVRNLLESFHDRERRPSSSFGRLPSTR